MIKLANFGIVKRTSPRNGNPVSLWKLGGFKGWLPAEAYDKTQFTTEMDVFALGLLFGYSLNKGCHPFGEEKDKRIVRIKESQPITLTLNQIQNVTDPEKVFKLITLMLSTTPRTRPNTTRILTDEFFNPMATAASNAVIPLPQEPEGKQLNFDIFLFVAKLKYRIILLLVPTISREIQPDSTDDDDISIIADYTRQSKRAKRT